MARQIPTYKSTQKKRDEQAKKIRKVYVPETTIKYPDGMTEEMAKNVALLIRRGSTPRMACIASGMSLAKYERHFTRGELMDQKVVDDVTTWDQLPEEDMVCWAFYKMIMGALAWAASHCAHKIKMSADWRAQAWRMDRVYGKLLDAPTPKQGGKVGADGLPVGEDSEVKVVIYVPDNGRSTKQS